MKFERNSLWIRWVGAFILGYVLLASPWAGSAWADTAKKELSLKEAAEFLGTTSKEIEHLVRTRQINARKVRGQWKISRDALELFLSYLKSLGRVMPPPGLKAMSDEESREVVGGESQRPTFGEELKKDKDEEAILIEYLSLRAEGVILQKGQFIVENSFSYGLDDRQSRFIGNIGFGTELVDQTVEDRTFRYDLILRYGLMNNVQLSVNLPYISSNRKTQLLGAGSNSLVNQDNENDGIGDIGLGLRGHFLKEKDVGFDLIVFAEGLVPTDFEPDTIFTSNDPIISLGQFAASAGITLIRPEDPGVLFFSIGGTHFFEKNVSGLGTLHSFTTVDYGVGFSLAMNDKFAPFFSVSGSVFLGDRDITSSVTNTTLSQDVDLVSFRMGFDYRFSRALYIEPSVTFGLTEDSQDVFFNLSIPYQFN